MRIRYNEESTDALEFALLHDWGEEASLQDGKIHGLTKIIEGNPTKYETSEPINATIKNMRIFGGYKS